MNHRLSTHSSFVRVESSHSGQNADSDFLRLGRRLAHRAAGLMLLLTALFLNLASPLHAQMYMNDPNAKVRLGFELRQISAADAQKIISGTVPGGEDEDNRWGNYYIDLWQYAYFNMDRFSQYVNVTSGRKTFQPQLTNATMSFYLQKKDGTLDKSRTIARIAPWFGDNSLTYPDGKKVNQPEPTPGVTAFFVNIGMDDGIQGWGAKTAAAGQAMTYSTYDDAVDTIFMEGQWWYRVKMTLTRFVWIKSESFYVNFVGDGRFDGEDKCAGVTNWNLSRSGTNPMYVCTKYQNWASAAGIDPNVLDGGCGPEYRDCLKYLQGGVEKNSGIAPATPPPPNT
ncbi:MAG: hypothetical protein K2I66_00340, partial [Bacteroidales bacterium]|nr:hypothetical protein [Bacteroidales bacterium]